jgi:hypothetical protein
VSPEQAETRLRHPLATQDGISLVYALLFVSGSMCPDCGYGTRATSKRWARCKKCGRSRIPRCSMDEAAAKLKAAESRTPRRAGDTI